MITDDLLRAIEASIGEPEFKARLLALLNRRGLVRAPKAATLHYQVETAGRLLEHGTCAEARTALQERFGVSRRTAYRLLARAMARRSARMRQF